MSGAADSLVDVFESALGAVFDPLLDLLAPEIDLPSTAQASGDSNNSLTDRRNRAASGRIADIVGSVVSVPSRLMQYRVFVDNVEKEIAYYCVGRDYIDIQDIRDGGTLGSSISGFSAEIFHPETSPKFGSPVETIGSSITNDIYSVWRSSELSQFSLMAPNELTTTISSGGCTVDSTGLITADSDEDAGFNNSYEIGDNVTLSNFTNSLNGTFEVLNVTSNTLTLDVTGNANWAALVGTVTINQKVTIKPVDAQESSFSDWIEFNRYKVDKVWVNCVAQSGIYKRDSDGIKEYSVDVRLEVEYLDDDNNPTGTTITQNGTLTGKSKDTKGLTLEVEFASRTKCRLRVARTNNTTFDDDISIVEDVIFRDAYSAQELDQDYFGYTTTILTSRTNTAQTTASSSTELTCIATEMLYKYEGGEFAATRTTNTDAMQSIIRMCLDENVGRMSGSELDLDQIIAVTDEIDAYFNVDCSNIGYTFSDDGQTIEQIITAIADSVNCTASRYSGKLQVNFERPQSTPVRLFTHRSKTGEETWTTKLGLTGQEFNGVEIEYLNLDEQEKVTYKFPEDGSATNPKKLSTIGLVNEDSAKIRAKREYNKILYGKRSVDFSVFEEGRYVKRNQLIEVVKGSRIDTQDGYIVAQDGTTLTLSNDVTFIDGDNHSITIKGREGAAEELDVIEGLYTNQVILSATPSLEIYTGNSELKTEFSFGNDNRHSAQLMLVQRTTANDGSVKIEAINSDSRYYQDDDAEPQREFSDEFSDEFG